MVVSGYREHVGVGSGGVGRQEQKVAIAEMKLRQSLFPVNVIVGRIYHFADIAMCDEEYIPIGVTHGNAL